MPQRSTIHTPSIVFDFCWILFWFHIHTQIPPKNVSSNVRRRQRRSSAGKRTTQQVKYTLTSLKSLRMYRNSRNIYTCARPNERDHKENEKKRINYNKCNKRRFHRSQVDRFCYVFGSLCASAALDVYGRVYVFTVHWIESSNVFCLSLSRVLASKTT